MLGRRITRFVYFYFVVVVLFYLIFSIHKQPKARSTIDALLRHPFFMYHESTSDDVVANWVTRSLEQFRIMKRFPSEASLASTSSSSWSGYSTRMSSSSHASGHAHPYMDTS
ncbi:hypothetical protein EMCRGX_G022318 [Ephydatia muelleri]